MNPGWLGASVGAGFVGRMTLRVSAQKPCTTGAGSAFWSTPLAVVCFHPVAVCT